MRNLNHNQQRVIREVSEDSFHWSHIPDLLEIVRDLDRQLTAAKSKLQEQIDQHEHWDSFHGSPDPGTPHF